MINTENLQASLMNTVDEANEKINAGSVLDKLGLVGLGITALLVISKGFRRGFNRSLSKIGMGAKNVYKNRARRTKVKLKTIKRARPTSSRRRY